MQAFKILGLLLLASILAVVALVLMNVAPRIGPVALDPVITNFEECAAAGNAVMESYPRQCRSKDGHVFVEELPDQATSTSPIFANNCAVAGCSGQLCVSVDEASTIVTTCEYRAEYSCYKEASCEPQTDGKFGWTQTAQLKQCLANPPALEGEMQLEVM